MPPTKEPIDVLQARAKRFDPHYDSTWSPWHQACGKLRGYITPEDIQDSIEAGAPKAALRETVLEALSRKVCEDWSLCAFVAFEFMTAGQKKRRRANFPAARYQSPFPDDDQG